ncbi:3-oxoacyl-ACP reductase FabG [bacterium]|nr:3-oxoacyl-ACP reductase FabG [bacterium]
MEFQDKVALITGSAQGIGKAAALAFAKEGAIVVLNDVNKERLSETASELEKTGARYLSILANTALRSDVEEMFNQVIEGLGRLDILVNNAGITRDTFLHKMTEDQWKQVIDVNLTGVFYCLQAAAKIMRKAGSGRIINISSAARFGNLGQANYSATKAGIVGLTRTAAKELASKNVLVNAISPGTINTEMVQAIPEKALERLLGAIPLGRIGTTDELCHLILFLASEKSSYITGQVINCDGGWFMA